MFAYWECPVCEEQIADPTPRKVWEHKDKHIQALPIEKAKPLPKKKKRWKH
jgi:hypothetical protein